MQQLLHMAGTSPGPVASPRTSATAASPARRWLLFVHQLPASPSNLRVRTWRRLLQIGAIPLKQTVYVLPDTPSTREDFEWLKTEVTSAGGDATILAVVNVDSQADSELVEGFRRSRQEAYAALARDLEAAIKRLGGRRRPGMPPAPPARQLGSFRERLTAIEGMDYFGSAGRDRVMKRLDELENLAARGRKRRVSAPPPVAGREYRGRVWITRPRPGVDRMASAWLIRRFIDPEARFAFAANRESIPADGVPYDMFGVAFSHQGGGCTFETLCARFGLVHAALSRIAGIVHDLDLKDERFGAPEAPAVAAMIEGLQLACPHDDALLAQGMTVFDALYRSFEQAARAPGPRPVAQGAKVPTTPPRRTPGAK